MITPCRHTAELRAYELAEARAEREWENQAEERAERLDRMTDEVMNEISEGRHDDELLNSPLIDLFGVMRIARMRADNYQRTFPRSEDLSALTDLNLQIAEYARDLAERRLLR